MSCFVVLAEAVDAATNGGQAGSEGVVPIDLMWEQITSLNLVEALTFISFGIVCLMYGWRVFKVLVVISFALLGLFLGTLAAEQFSGADHKLIGALAGLAIMAMLAIPLMRWAVSILGAAAGGVVTAGIWYAAGLPEQYIWAGGLIGVVAGGMVAFIGFRIAVILFSSMGGSALIVIGALAVLHMQPQTQQQVQTLVFTEKWFLPAALLIPAAAGLVLQHKFLKRSANWSI